MDIVHNKFNCYNIPVVSTIVAVFLCAVEMLSIWEKADRKRRNEAAKTAGLISELISKDTLREAIREALLKTGDREAGPQEEQLNDQINTANEIQ
jgi:hypothetical protein